MGYDERLRGGSDFVFWTKLFARHRFRFHVIPGHDAVYFRRRSQGSLSRQEVSFDFNVAMRLDCIESLGAIGPSTRDVEQLVTRMIQAQCRLIREYLYTHPEARQDVTEAVDSRGLRRFDWAWVNGG